MRRKHGTHVIISTFFRAAKMMLGLVWLVKKAEWRDWNVAKMFSSTAARMPDKIMLYFEDEKWTFKQVREGEERERFVRWGEVQSPDSGFGGVGHMASRFSLVSEAHSYHVSILT